MAQRARTKERSLRRCREQSSKEAGLSGNEFIIGSGKEALLVRYHSGRRRLEANDQLTIEFAGVLPALSRLSHANDPHRRAFAPSDRNA